MAFGGTDCDTVADPDGSYSADREEEAGLDTSSGNTAAISNLQFCLVPEEDIEIPEGGNTSVGFEDLPKSVGNDYDYNDFVILTDISKTYLDKELVEGGQVAEVPIGRQNSAPSGGRDDRKRRWT